MDAADVLSDEYANDIEHAARLLVEKLLEIHRDSRYMAVWSNYMIHGGNYVGPQYDKELRALQSALGIVS